MRKLPKLVHVVNSLAPGAIPNILRNLQQEFRHHYQTTIVSLEPIRDRDDVLRSIEAGGAEIVSLDCSRLNLAQQYLRLRRFLHERRPDIAHAHLGRAEVLTPLVAPRETYTVATYHQVDGHHRATRLLMMYSNRRLGVRTFVSHAVAKAWQGEDYAASQVIYNPIDTRAFAYSQDNRLAVREELGLAPATALLLTAGRLIACKGHADLLNAAALLKRRSIGKFVVAIAGEGEMERPMRQMCEDLNIVPQVRFLGFRNDIPRLLCAADLFIFPSHREGLGLAPIEAMSSGTPVIVSDYLAGREYVQDGVTGIVFGIGDQSALADAIERYMRCPDDFEVIRENAKKLVEQKFNSQAIAFAYKALYDAGTST